MNEKSEKKQVNGLGIASMVVGIIAFLLSCCGAGGFIGIVSLILGIVGLAQKNKGKGMATSGVILSSIAILIAIFTVSNGSLGDYIEKSKESQQSEESINNVDNNDPEITLDEFNQIETGMSYEEVADIIGSDGTLSSESTVGDITQKMYVWYGENGISNANFLFQNNELISKAQMGLD